jgi:hypothetical protein
MNVVTGISVTGSSASNAPAFDIRWHTGHHGKEHKIV